MMTNPYDKNFYDQQQHGSRQSAQEVFPHLFKYMTPTSAIDIGCGVGTWLDVLVQEFGVKDILGVDGNYVLQEQLLIPLENFCAFNLSEYFPSPKKYDLAISLEVAEHLPENAADSIVRSLTGASDVILFSAATIGQSGTNHINNQYPEYWAEKFSEKGFVPIDCLRKEVWHNNQVEPWYSQNMLIFIQRDKLATMHPELQDFASHTDPLCLARVHPLLMHDQKRQADELACVISAMAALTNLQRTFFR